MRLTKTLMTADNNKEKGASLFLETDLRMHTEKLFADVKLNRKKLAVYMNTNEVYLAESIREVTGKTFSEYLSDIRLKHALRVTDECPDMNFDIIVSDSGYGSYTKFYRSFTKKYGISPMEYRRLSAKNRAIAIDKLM